MTGTKVKAFQRVLLLNPLRTVRRPSLLSTRWPRTGPDGWSCPLPKREERKCGRGRYGTPGTAEPGLLAMAGDFIHAPPDELRYVLVQRAGRPQPVLQRIGEAARNPAGQTAAHSLQRPSP